MSEKTAEEVLELARERIAQRQLQEQGRQDQEDDERNRPWRYAFLAAMGVLVAGLLLIPGVPLDQKMAIVLHGMCSQVNNVSLGGIEFPICARCSGIYITVLVTLAYLWAIGRGRAGRIPPVTITAVLLIFVLLIAVDGLNSMVASTHVWQLYEPHDELRSLTGTGTGVGMAVLLLLMFNLSLRRNVNDQQPVIANWREFATILAINFLVLVAIYGTIDIMAWPLAILAFLGMNSVVYIVSVILVGLFMGYDGSISRMTELAKPATLALIPTLLLVGGMSLLRFWLEAQGLMPV